MAPVTVCNPRHFSFIVDSWSPCSSSCGEGVRFRKVECKIFMEFSKTVATLPDKECPGVKPAETEICVETPSCESPGREQIMSDELNVLSETLPSVNEPETLPLLLGDAAIEEEPSYVWKIAGFTTCTASCLGGDKLTFVLKSLTPRPFRITRVHRDLRGGGQGEPRGSLPL